MEIKLTHEESEEYFYNSLCNGLGYMQSSYDLRLEYDESAYDNARDTYKHRHPNETACYEDVLMQLLKNGGVLTIIDEQDEEEQHTIKLSDVHERVAKTPIRHLTDMIEGNDDAVTADVILQTVFLEEVIYG